jgi:hypothetical protein
LNGESRIEKGGMEGRNEENEREMGRRIRGRKNERTERHFRVGSILFCTQEASGSDPCHETFSPDSGLLWFCSVCPFNVCDNIQIWLLASSSVWFKIYYSLIALPLSY